MHTIGVDAHKRVHEAVALDAGDERWGGGGCPSAPPAGGASGHAWSTCARAGPGAS